MPIKSLLKALRTEFGQISTPTIFIAPVIAFTITSMATDMATQETSAQRNMLGEDGAYRLDFYNGSYTLGHREFGSPDLAIYDLAYGKNTMSGVFYQAVNREGEDTDFTTYAIPSLEEEDPDYEKNMHMACLIALQMATSKPPLPFIADVNQNNALGARFLRDFCL